MTIFVDGPSSKSYTQRALVLASLSRGPSTIVSPADCDDSRLLASSLESLGVEIHWRGGELHVAGWRGLSPPEAPLLLDNAGTAVRFLSAMSLIVDFEIEIDGIEAMRRRPMKGLLAALRVLGIEVSELGKEGCPPVRLRGPHGGLERVELDPSGSSQQLSAILLVAPKIMGGLTIGLEAEVPSKPYVEMTLDAIRAFGGSCRWIDSATIRVEPGGLRGRTFNIEGDLSAAAMIKAGAWINERDVEIRNLPKSTLQGDRVIDEILEKLSEEGRQNNFDLRDAPDVVPAVVAAALFAHGETRIHRVAHLRHKECDRLAVLAGELEKLGASIEQQRDALVIRPSQLRPGHLDPHGDHRMAMAFGLVRLRVPDVEIDEPECVSKSFPGFWDALERLR